MKRFKVLSVALVMFGCAAVGSAQTLQEVTEARNKGAELMSSNDFDGAIAELEKCVEISKQVGEEADEHRMVAESALPNLYLQKADKILDTKNYEAALKAFDEAIAVAEIYNNPEAKEKAEKPVSMVYYAMGTAAFQSKKFDEANHAMDQAIARDPNLAKAYFIKGASYQSLKDVVKMTESYNLAIEKGEATGDAATVKSAKSQLSKYFYNDGITDMKQKKWDDAIAAFTKAVDADDTFADAYYRIASSYNYKKSWDQAITNGEKALEFKLGDDAKATDGIYYELGTAYAGKKDNGKACDCFKKVTAEPFLTGAKYQIGVALKCK